MKVIERFIEPLKTTFRFIVGQNAKDNFDIIDDADQNDYWFHVYNESSCHVICDLSTQTITLDKKELRYVLKQGAIICKENFSKHKSNRDLTIVYTQIKNVVKTKVVGMVSLSESKTIRV
jgi:predicted ribosome quality control (RQC) complex YloA/Tae2 family protein